ncbi:MAG: hypothetical protein ABIM30_09985, partial [candidate division WOR-3 bacterium]
RIAKKSVLEVLHFWLCYCTFVAVMRVRKNILPPTTLSRPYFLIGHTVVKVGVSMNEKEINTREAGRLMAPSTEVLVYYHLSLVHSA